MTGLLRIFALRALIAAAMVAESECVRVCYGVCDCWGNATVQSSGKARRSGSEVLKTVSNGDKRSQAIVVVVKRGRRSEVKSELARAGRWGRNSRQPEQPSQYVYYTTVTVYA